MKGINRVKTTLADGQPITYYYAWKGGPRLQGVPGSPEFVHSYNQAIAKRLAPTASTLQLVFDKFQASGEWSKLAKRTQSDYSKLIKTLEINFGTMPISGLADKRSRTVFLEWRDERAKSSPRQADYGLQVLARILEWAYRRALVPANPCQKIGRLYDGNRVDKIWTIEQEEAFLAHSPEHLRLPLLMALWTGQREGDLLAMNWRQYDGTYLRLKQSKTGAKVIIPVGQPLKEVLDNIPNKEGPILLNSQGKRWTPDGFRTSWRKAVKKAGVVGVTFNDLRGTAITRLAIAGCTEAQIASISGHTLTEVRSILDKNYLHRDIELSTEAIRKLENANNSPKRAPK